MTPETNSKPNQKSNMEIFASLVNNGKPLTNFAKSDSENISGLTVGNRQNGWIAAHNSEIAGKQSLGGVLLKTCSESSQESTCVRVTFLIKLQSEAKKRPWRRCFSLNFAKFLRTHFYIEHLRWPLPCFHIKLLWTDS